MRTSNAHLAIRTAFSENVLDNFSDKHWYTSFSTPYFFLFTYIHAQRHYNIPCPFKPDYLSSSLLKTPLGEIPMSQNPF